MSNTVKILGIAGGVGAVVIIGIIAYGEMTRPAGSDILERPTEQWKVGNSLEENTVLTYRLFHIDNNYEELKITIEFIEKQDGNWRSSITIEDPLNGTNRQDLLMSQSMIPVSAIEPNVKPYMKMVQSSVLWIVDYAIEPKYLTIGAVWGIITHGVQREDLKITARDKAVTDAGTFDSYILSYKMKDKESAIWIVKDKPLPVKAEVYDVDGNLQFKFELLKNS